MFHSPTWLSRLKKAPTDFPKLRAVLFYQSVVERNRHKKRRRRVDSLFFLRRGQTERVKRTVLHLPFPVVPLKMKQFLFMGDRQFDYCLEAVKVELIIVKDMHIFLKFFNKRKRVSAMTGGAAGLEKDLETCKNDLFPATA